MPQKLQYWEQLETALRAEKAPDSSRLPGMDYHEPVLLPASFPTLLRHATTKEYVDTQVAGGVRSFNARNGDVILNQVDVVSGLGYIPYDTANPAGYQTQANINAILVPYALTSALPIASSTLPLMDSTAAVGTSATFARSDHIHPVDTSRYAVSNPANYQSDVQVTSAINATVSNYVPLSQMSVALGVATLDATGKVPSIQLANYQTDTQVASIVNATVSNYVPLSQRGVALGVAALDSSGRVPTAQLPAAATGTLNYKGGWNAATNSPAMTSGALVGGVTAPNGDYYVVTVGGTTPAIDGNTIWVAGDWIASNGVVWSRVQNSTSPYLPLTGSSPMTGPLTLAGGDTLGAVDARLRYSYVWQDSTGQIAGVINYDGSLSWSTFSANNATILGGSAILSALTAASPTFSGTTAVANLTASGSTNLQALSATSFSMAGPLAVGMLTVGSDVWRPFDQRIQGYSYGWFDPAGNMAGAIANDGTLTWNLGAFTTLNVTNLNAVNFALPGGALVVNSLVLPSSTFGVLDPRISGISYAWLDPSSAIGAAIANDGTFQMGLASVSTNLTLGFDAVGPNDALRKSYADTAYINSSGGTMTGALMLPASTPTNPNQAASKAYVDSSAASGGGGGLSGLAAQRDFPYPPLRDPKRDYNAVGNGIADDSTAINNCAAAALAAGERAIAINDTYNCPNLDRSTVSAVLMIGIGSLVNNNVTMFVIPPWAPSAPSRLRNTTMNLRNHCPKFAAKLRAQTINDPAPVVVVTGESTYAPSTSASIMPLFWARAQYAMNEANPGKRINYINRAIGGQTWTTLDAIPTGLGAFPSWYTNTSRAWIEYIRDLAPDVVVIGLSANDGAAFALSHMLSVLSKFAGFANPPEIILATSNPYAQQYSGQTNTASVWEGQMSTAGMERTWAMAKGLGLVDTSRAITVHAKGFDSFDIPFRRDLQINGGSSGRKPMNLPFTSTTRCWGYAGSWFINANNWTALGNELQFELGQSPLATVNNGCILRFGRDPVANQMYYEVDTSLVSYGASQDSIHIPKTFIPGWTKVASDTTSFNITIGSGRVIIQCAGGTGNSVNQDQWTATVMVDVPRYDQPWFPKITCSAGAVSGAIVWEVTNDAWAYFASAVPDQRAFYMPSMTERECWGTNSQPDIPWNGGGVGHDSELKGVWGIQCAINSCDWGA